MLVAVKVEEVNIHFLVTGYGVFEGEKWTLCKLGETNRCSHTAGNAGVKFFPSTVQSSNLHGV